MSANRGHENEVGGGQDRQALPTPWVAQAGRDRVAVMTGLTTFLGRTYLCGPALTCACVPGDNLAMHAAIYQAPPGTVIVCDGGGTIRTGLAGEFMATEAAGRRLAGIVPPPPRFPPGRTRCAAAWPPGSACPTSSAWT
jgi:4-hydroxy-4-methyl-2-oxoglutarate aldolase